MYKMSSKKRSSFSNLLKRSIGSSGAGVDLRGKGLDGDAVEQHVEEALRKGPRKVAGLDLRENVLGLLPEALLSLPHFVTLSRLNLDSNLLTSLPDVLGTLANLRSLSARSNRFAHVPPCILQLDRLEKLDLSDNEITSLPLSIANMRSMAKLRLSKNKLRKLPSSIICMASLKLLAVKDNPLISPPCTFLDNTDHLVEHLEYLYSLQEMNVAATKFRYHLLMPYSPDRLRSATKSKMHMDNPDQLVVPVSDQQEWYTNGCLTYFTLHSGIIMQQGERAYMEDRAEMALEEPFPDIYPGLKVAFAGMYDGHGGSQVVEFLLTHLRRAVFSEWVDMTQKRLSILSQATGKELTSEFSRFSPMITRKVGKERSNSTGGESSPRPGMKSHNTVKKIKGIFYRHNKNAASKRSMSDGDAEIQGVQEEYLRERGDTLSADSFDEDTASEGGAEDSDGVELAAEEAAKLEVPMLQWDTMRPENDMGETTEETIGDLAIAKRSFRRRNAEETAAVVALEDILLTALHDSLPKAFESVDQSIIQKFETSGVCADGSTAVVLLFMQNQMIVAHCGDTRAVLCRGGVAVDITKDHKPNDPRERARIVSVGGTVKRMGPVWRVNGSLSTSRSLGDVRLKPAVSSVPDISVIPLSPMDSLIVIATDGLWDVMSSEYAIEVASSINDPQQAATRLVADAMERNTADNTSVSVLRLCWDVGTLEDVQKGSDAT